MEVVANKRKPSQELMAELRKNTAKKKKEWICPLSEQIETRPGTRIIAGEKNE